MYQVLHQDDGSFSLTDIHEAKARRDLLGPAFSRRAILRLENVIRSKVRTVVSLCRKPVDHTEWNA